ncbi:MAG: hypothetical protein UR25_C0003G0161 [Candidatus Nomurabacteria bacterium GW2011_GWE1_32_28]|uniref:Uncharacterized protein n=1 Tax=Candidatus Nomurabacteria bacterium GW2011_GWF1_31_48 TaxID=1618767 RepID=A0A0F9YG23_9BACT|nr:MAG: hypothetical protein UR10_C0003G0160 [Candidatus Nomurabacteria bacterium GW2011_GWF2_30_133]KKP28800.1 MAG: hypothetical protein UR18_C0002G0212 [Candidatus Nomurabacteria bacterium GW2011_GWE2_31_40]KKP30378.1 MAG: hypothetical protein UR19_C0003G0214 [Candidatus Nomurabacteria bacterium GW2011_GWF1_31_48]KKP34905.1 MAG: hypothetical protein UR25_C0003G0161 [Candidatus Nomurabacteria bacterium GW2011_GWE1_32_28]HAS80997.1 hypothetical protein [Candidatus Nomurabacteria bacterium]
MNTTIDLLQIKINKAREELPKETIEAIDAVDWKSIIIKMREEKGYSFEQLENLEIETELLLCGLTNTENYPKELETRMNLPKAQIDELVNEINEKVFRKIREELVMRVEKNKKTNKNTENINENLIESREEMLKHIENTQSINNYELRITNEDKDKKQLGITNFELEITDGKDKSITNGQLPITNLEEKKKDTPSLLSQKLSGSFNIPTVETNHSIPNVTKISERNKPELTRVDPYRMPIE